MHLIYYKVCVFFFVCVIKNEYYEKEFVSIVIVVSFDGVFAKRFQTCRSKSESETELAHKW